MLANLYAVEEIEAERREQEKRQAEMNEEMRKRKEQQSRQNDTQPRTWLQRMDAISSGLTALFLLSILHFLYD